MISNNKFRKSNNWVVSFSLSSIGNRISSPVRPDCSRRLQARFAPMRAALVSAALGGIELCSDPSALRTRLNKIDSMNRIE